MLTERQQYIADFFAGSDDVSCGSVFDNRVDAQPGKLDQATLQMIELYASHGPEMCLLRDLLSRIVYTATTCGHSPDLCQEISNYLGGLARNHRAQRASLSNSADRGYACYAGEAVDCEYNPDNSSLDVAMTNARLLLDQLCNSYAE